MKELEALTSISMIIEDIKHLNPEDINGGKLWLDIDIILMSYKRANIE